MRRRWWIASVVSFGIAGCSGIEPEEAPQGPVYRMVRCGYLTEGCVHHVDVDSALDPSSPGLARALEALRQLKQEPLPQARVPARRTCEIQIAMNDQELDYLVIEDPGDDTRLFCVVLFPPERHAPAEVSDEGFLRWLRILAHRALFSAMQSPRRPLEWHYVALADFLSFSSKPFAYATEFLQYLQSASDPRPVARALYRHADGFTEPQLEPFRASDKVALQLLPLASRALRGDREALREILTLSLEYPSELPTFESAIRAFFRPALNSSLYAKYPETGRSAAAVGLLAEVQARLEEAKFRGEQGWTLEVKAP